MIEKVSKMMEKLGVSGPHCGNCAWWRTELYMDGEYCGWIGTCGSPDSPVEREVDADDYCREYEQIKPFKLDDDDDEGGAR